MQLFSVNEEFLVSTISSECADYVPVLCTHRPSLLPIECFSEIFGLVFRVVFGSFGLYRKDAQTGSFRGSKSRNKVFVGEPAYGSLSFLIVFYIHINNILTSHNFSTHSLLNVFDSLCRTIMLTKQVYYYTCFETFPFNKFIVVCH